MQADVVGWRAEFDQLETPLIKWGISIARGAAGRVRLDLAIVGTGQYI